MIELLVAERQEAQQWTPTTKDVNDFRKVLATNDKAAAIGYKNIINNEFKLDQIEKEYMRRYHIFLEQRIRTDEPFIRIAILRELRHYYNDAEFDKLFDREWKEISDTNHHKIKQAEEKLYKQFESMEIK